jgi:ABC-type nitrate/sulfonate/bicarbonate transport system ATPase subunit
MVRLRLEGVGKTYRSSGREIRAVDGIDLELLEGELATLVGPSGSGKTTLLRIAAGLEDPDSGRATLRAGTKLGFVFQEPRLLGSLTVEGNVALGLGSRRAEREGGRRVDEVLGLLGLREHRRAYPAELSGGLAQRAALGRALVRDPELLFMDEPFSALDAPLRRRLQDELLAILASRRTSALFVTHDLAEALYLGDRVVALRSGRIVRNEQVALGRPRDPRRADFVGLVDSLAITLGGSPRRRELAELEFDTPFQEDSA